MKTLASILLALVVVAALYAQVLTPGAGGSGGGGGGGGSSLWNAPVAYGSIPACSTTEYFQPLTDSFYDWAYCDGSSALSYNRNGATLVPPPTSGWSWVNQDSATITSTGGGLVLVSSTQASIQHNIRTRSAPSTPYTVEAVILPWVDIAATQRHVTFGLREAGTSKLVTFSWNFNSAAAVDFPRLMVQDWTNETTFANTDFSMNQATAFQGAPLYLRVGDTGTNITYEYSNNEGVTWVTAKSETRGTFFTTAPDEVFFGAGTDNSNIARTTVISWDEQ